MIKKIVIASVLKPVDDVRVYWKIAQSLAKTNKYEVNIIGNVGKKESGDNKIIFQPHFLRRNQWIKRVTLPVLLLWKTYRLRPDIFVITTHELLYCALILKWLQRCKIIYDIQENYAWNARMNTGLVHHIYSYYIRLKERLSTHLFDTCWLAEKCYASQLDFHKGRYTMLENKALEHSIQREESTNLRILFSGTISTYSGAEKALNVMIQLLEHNPDYEGLFIGQIHHLPLLKFMKNQRGNLSNLTLQISQDPVPYEEILNKMAWANVGIISYQENKINREKIPTKLYEYSRYRLPYLVQENTLWAEMGKALGGAIPFDFNSPKPDNIHMALQNPSRLFPVHYPIEATWEFESEKLSYSIDQLT